MNKGTIGGVGGAIVGYKYWPGNPLVGAAIGYFAGKLAGDAWEKKARANAEAARVQQQIDQGTAF